MDIIAYSNSLQKRLEDLKEAIPENHDLARLAQAVTTIRQIMLDLKSFTSSYKFADTAEEIRFFKQIKPVLLSQYIFYKKLFALKLHESFNDTTERIKNYHSILARMERFAIKHKVFYEYCMSGSTELDALYFTRNGQKRLGIQKDLAFSTGFDTKVAKLLAYELLKGSVANAIRRSESTRSLSTGLTWTDSKVALIELIYALQSASAINSGRSDIKQIVDGFEKLFSIDLGNYGRTFAELRMRKSGHTNFIESLKSRLVQYINEGDKR